MVRIGVVRPTLVNRSGLLGLYGAFVEANFFVGPGFFKVIVGSLGGVSRLGVVRARSHECDCVYYPMVLYRIVYFAGYPSGLRRVIYGL